MVSILIETKRTVRVVAQYHSTMFENDYWIPVSSVHCRTLREAYYQIKRFQAKYGKEHHTFRIVKEIIKEEIFTVKE